MYVTAQFLSETVSDNYSDIGTIKIDAYINTQCAHADAITGDKQRRINGFDVVRAASNEADGKCIPFVTSDLLPRQGLHDIYENQCSRRLLSAQIRSFRVNNKPVEYT